MRMTNWRHVALRFATNRALIVLIAAILGLVLTFNIAKNVEDNQFKQRALAVAESVASIPQVAAFVEGKGHGSELQALATKVASQTGARYIVIADNQGIRLTHPNSSLIGLRIDGPLLALQGKSYTTVNSGSLGRSANGKTPIFNASGKIVGLVSAGFLTSNFTGETSYLRKAFLLYGIGLIILGFFLAEFLARRLRSRKVEMELQTIRTKYQEREAMLHAIKEGVITLTPNNRIILINDEAKRLLQLDENSIGKSIDSLIPQGRLLDLLEGEVFEEDDGLVLNESFSLRVNHRPVKLLGKDIGAVITVRDRTEHIGLMRELDSVKNLTNALRAQQHEYSNRMHTLTGLLELKRYEEAAQYLGEISHVDANLAETLRDKLDDPTIAALLLAKVSIAREKGVKLEISPLTSIGDLTIDQNAKVTVVGNLIDNAIEATAGMRGAEVKVLFDRVGSNAKRIQVSDNGPGLPEPNSHVVFEDGFSTKSFQANSHRGMGLAIVSRMVKQASGTIDCRNENGAIFTVLLSVKS